MHGCMDGCMVERLKGRKGEKLDGESKVKQAKATYHPSVQKSRDSSE